MTQRLTVLMLSWLRYNNLLQTLRELPTSCTEPLHLILRVQGSERISGALRSQIIDAASGFASTDIYFTRYNIGTAAARLDLIHRGARYGSPYMMFTDDDITFQEGGIDKQIAVLEANPDVGSVSLRPKGIVRIRLAVDGSMVSKLYSNITDELCEVFLVGSASIMFRSFLYTKHLVAPDSRYYIGIWDWDFVMQIRQAGYKVTVIPDCVIINRGGGDKEYRQVRKNTQYIEENRRLFVEKWKLEPPGDHSSPLGSLDHTKIVHMIEGHKFSILSLISDQTTHHELSRG